VRPRRCRRSAIAILAALLVTGVGAVAADTEHMVTGMVVALDPARRTMTVSHERIAGLMEAMTMPFEVRDARELRDLVPGAVVEFTLVVGDRTSYATRIVIKRYETVERDPRNARRLSLMKRIAGMTTPPVAIGARVPDFTLTDQRDRPVRLSTLRGQVVAVNFVYTRCALPQFCLRMANAFGAVQKRFQKELGRDLTLLTITFDPERDTPDVLRAYADRWNPHATGWRFLTGGVDEIGRVSALFGQEAFPEEGLMNHSLHTAIIGRTGALVANIEGNEFTPEQLGDLIAATLRR
jgi:protein SCO1/2